MPFNTIALEFVPPTLEDGPEKAAEEARRVRDRAREFGMEGEITHLMFPGMIDEEEDRPVPMTPRMDPLDVWNSAKAEVPDMSGLCTQVTAFLDHKALEQRFRDLSSAGMDGVIFVGVPRTMEDGEGSGVAPTDALAEFQESVPNRGVILIPTREGEQGRFNFKCDRGATFGMTQLLYSDAIVPFLTEFAKTTEHRPEILLSFGFVPKIENKVKLINWLIQDHGNAAVADEQAFVSAMADMDLREKKQVMLDLYKKCVDGVRDLGFPLSIHLECPYGFSKPAFETFAHLLDYYNPRKQ